MEEENIQWLPNVWNIKTLEKIKIFLWKSLHGAIPVGEQFAIRNIPVSPLCARCKEVESVSHLFFHCPYAKDAGRLPQQLLLWMFTALKTSRRDGRRLENSTHSPRLDSKRGRWERGSSGRFGEHEINFSSRIEARHRRKQSSELYRKRENG